MVETICGDVLEWCASYDGPKFHAMLCDPPYELGFMGRSWDRSGIAFRPETWAALSEHLLPGAFCFAFASTRGLHRMMVAIEDAGFVIHPMLVWVFGSGFPKATRIKDAPAFEGHRYGLQALKPSLEPVVCFQKPYRGKLLDSIVEFGSGALNIEGGRVPTSDDLNGGAYVEIGGRVVPPGDLREGSDLGMYQPGKTVGTSFEQPSGRWPANLILDEESGRVLDGQSGVSKLSPSVRCNNTLGDGVKYGKSKPYETSGHSDSGGASRFFHSVNWALEDAEPFFYTAKASRAERDAGLSVDKQLRLDDSHAGRKEALDNPFIRGKSEMRNNHPTVKPLSLSRHLATLLLPPALYAPRRLLNPFAGSHSEAIGAMLAGWEHVTAIEMDPSYCEIGRQRVAHHAPLLSDYDLFGEA